MEPTNTPTSPGFETLANVPLEQPAERVSQQDLLPASVKSRMLGDIISSQPTSDALGSGLVNSTTIAAETSASFLFTVADPQGRPIIATADIAFYVDAFTSDNRWPNPTYGMGNMPTSVFGSWADTDNKNYAVRATIRNSTAFDHLVFCVCRFRIIANPSDTTSPNNLITTQGHVVGIGGH